MSNYTNSVLYIGVTNNLLKRVFQHKTKSDPDSFCAKYNVNKLVYYEEYKYIKDALYRESKLKSYSRIKKNHFVQLSNPCWMDLAEDW